MPLRKFFRRFYVNSSLGIVVRKNKRFPIKTTIVLLLLISILVYATIKIRPLVTGMASAAVKNAVTIAVNEAISEKMSSGKYEYESLIKLEKDESGMVSAIVANMVNINRLKAEITETITEKVQDNKTADISIPLGNIIGGSYLSGRGPHIKFRIISVSSTKAAFINSFTASGINQTRNQIIVEAVVAVSVLVPGAITSVNVETQIIIAECVIVGRVPDSYTYFESGGKAEGSENWDTNFEKYDIIT